MNDYEKTVDEMREIVALCQFTDGHEYTFSVDMIGGAIFLQGKYPDTDIITGKTETQYTRRWALSPYMTRSEIVQTVFKCCITSMEHRCREAFKYRGKRIFGPHFDVDALHGICGQIDVRKEGH